MLKSIHVHASEHPMQGLHHVPEQAHRLHLDRLMDPFLCSYLDNMTSERVDAEGVKNIAAAAKANFQTQVPLVSLPLSLDLVKQECPY